MSGYVLTFEQTIKKSMGTVLFCNDYYKIASLQNKISLMAYHNSYFIIFQDFVSQQFWQDSAEEFSSPHGSD